MEINYYLNNLDNYEVALILNSSFNQKIVINADNVNEFLLRIANKQRIDKVLKMLGLENNVLSKNKNSLSSLEEALVIIAWQLLQRKYLIIYYLDSFLNYKEKRYLKRVLNKIAHEYNIKMLVFSNDMKFCFDFVDKVFITDGKEIVKVIKNDYYDFNIYKYIDIPDIVSFVLSAKDKGYKLDNYTEISELLKGINRL